MAPLPFNRPRQLSLGPLEAEILTILWRQEPTTAKAIHDCILSDPSRELAYPSVMTVLQRLQRKGWVRCQGRRPAQKGDRGQRPYYWVATISQAEATQLQAHDHLKQFLSVGNPDIVAAFADSLDAASLDQLDAIVQRLRAARQQREEG